MKFIKFFKLGQKGAKRARKAKGGAAAPAPAWPEGTRVGVFGHENSGKTVFFTALYTQSKTTNDFHISVRDNATANEFFKNDMAIKGVDVDSGGTGTIAAKSVPKRFPAHTEADVLLQFTAILDGGTKIPVVTYDYNGRAASISERSDAAEKIRSFMADADGLLFFFDPKILQADPEVQARVSSFVNVLELVVSLKSRLPIPVGLVITKADTLPGYAGEEKTILIRPEDEQVVADDYEKFLERVLGFESLSNDREWASSVRNILVKLREFIRVVVGRTLDFQIFFVSSTGNTPEKIGAEVGRSIYAPPEKVNPCGVTVPFHWILTSIVRSRRLNVLGRVARFVAAISAVWIVLCSLFFIWHFGVLLRSPVGTEKKVLKEAGGDYRLMSSTQNADIFNAYKRYGNRLMVKKWFPEYQAQAGHMKDLYGGLGLPSDAGRLDAMIVQLAGEIADEKTQPVYDQGKKSVRLGENTKRLLDEIRDMHKGDENEGTYKRAGRVLFVWGLYERYLANPSDAAIGTSIWDQIGVDAKTPDYDESERRLDEALMGIVGKTASQSAPTLQDVKTNLGEYDGLKSAVNGEDADPAFVLGEAVQKLEAIRGNLVRGVHDAQLSSINAYLAEARQWERKRTYAFRLQSVPNDGHIHLEVTESGENPRWDKVGNQYMQGDKIDVEWQPGEEIHIAFDEAGAAEHWGKTSSDGIVLRDAYALFQMDGPVTLLKGTRIQFSYKGGLKQALPKLK
jgi:hypothetical protein